MKLRALALSALISACGGGGLPPSAQVTSSPAPTPTFEATTAPSPTAAATATGALTFVVSSGSKATVRVNEQLADRSTPNDAVLTTSAFSGEFVLLPDGTFDPRSKITVDLRTLQSDNRLRDRFIRDNTLETDRFPDAELVPTRTTGLALPLAASGTFSFVLEGRMTVHGVQKDLRFDVTAERRGADLTATAKVTPNMKFGDFGMTQPRVLSVLSIADDIHLEVELIAKQG